ncbi:hypothetical protein H2203_008421 [Taxawa tesnikishii (nom. ined.)]|nr:hypothetical protein H2203_008421 [Dothideales sp. JES 119]
MGFTTGFVGGIALTSTFLYLSLSLHQRNRLYQSSLLRQQAQVLTSLSDPHPQPLTPERRAPREGLAERVKDRWNAELELNVRKLQSLDWDRVREDLERGVSGLWARAFRGRGREWWRDRRAWWMRRGEEYRRGCEEWGELG